MLTPYKLLYASPNGDRWFLCYDMGTDRMFVRHEPNRSSGGQVTDLDIATFLTNEPVHPQQQALLRLIATLVLDSDPS